MDRIPLIGRVRDLFVTVRESYWVLPMVMALGAGVSAVALVSLDRRVSLGSIPGVSDAGPEGTLAVLSAIAGSMITVTGVVFSITIVSLTLASSQFGPRLLRNFLRDRANQVAFGTFVATFLYSLLVLRSVRADESPHIATTVAVGLAALSVFVLVYFIHHTATSIQASSVIAAVAKEIQVQLPKVFSENIGPDDDGSAEIPDVEAIVKGLETSGTVLRAPSSGFIRIIDAESLMKMVEQQETVLLLERRPGDFVVQGARIARMGSCRDVDDARAAFEKCVIIGDHRTPVQDMRFLVGQLTEIALRALSPGVNDPRTAVDCVYRLAAVVCAASTRSEGSPHRHDETGQLRVIAPTTTF
ncbi:MAG: DUF2254 domain-containing protein, partial [Polyangiales bacterium]